MTLRTIKRLIGRRDGATTIEFALTIPIFILLVVGLLQLGILFAAKTGLRHAVDEGARLAAVYPRPSDSAITDRITSNVFAVNADNLGTPSISHGTANGVAYTDISLSYSLQLNFIVMESQPITLNYARRVY